jgi:hypothetical protein
MMDIDSVFVLNELVELMEGLQPVVLVLLNDDSDFRVVQEAAPATLSSTAANVEETEASDPSLLRL